MCVGPNNTIKAFRRPLPTELRSILLLPGIDFFIGGISSSYTPFLLRIFNFSNHLSNTDSIYDTKIRQIYPFNVTLRIN